jgi:hypothetical protein
MKQLGEKFEDNGVTLEVVKAPNPEVCTGCYFNHIWLCNKERKYYACSADEREDKENIVFKKVE